MMSKEENNASKTKWTVDQQKAIDLEGSDILVAAAAGSGKTAVLVERIIQKIIREENPINVDELLVVTFTKASAQEMKERIGVALEKQLVNNPESDHLRKQASLLNKASISTIHSFCTEVIRSNYYMVELDPNFRTAEEVEIQLLMDEVLEELMEAEYSDDSNLVFFDLVNRYTSDRDDNDLPKLILKLYRHAISNPNPSEFLNTFIHQYDVKDKLVDDIPFIQELKRFIQEDIIACINAYKQALNLIESPDGPIKYFDVFKEEYSNLECLYHVSEKTWEEINIGLQKIAFTRLPIIKKTEGDQQKKEIAANFRKDVKKKIDDLKEKYFSRNINHQLKQIIELKPLVEKLIGLVNNFIVLFKQAKLENGILDFNDLEHYALEILKEKEETDQLLPSSVARVYQEKFSEVLVDEYQDTNYVQESILRLITKGTGSDGNLFMVGDVKQSIYRFRLAEPQLFIDKYNLYEKESNDRTGLRIDLSKNFRSRAEVLDATNFIFQQIMGREIGGIEYDEDAMLKLGASYPEYSECTSELILLTNSADEDDIPEVSELEDDELVEEKLEQIEARYVARRIKDLIESEYLVTEKTGEMRPVKYSDIAILGRSLSNADLYIEECKALGIPLYAEKSKDLFQTIEVAVFLNLLKLIDNTIQDIPLASVLRSPIVGLTEPELTVIRLDHKKGSFYEACQAYTNNFENRHKQLSIKLANFFQQIKEWKRLVKRETLSIFIWKVLNESTYYDFVGGLPGGKQRQANLITIFDRAKALEESNYRSLFQFLRFLDRMQERDEKLDEVRIVSDQENIVQMMTIHKSKGLEFPVVFVVNTSKQFNMQDLNAKFILQKELGLGMNYVHPTYRTTNSTLLKETIKRKEQRELISEELRILYVALTRAREKLILVGKVKDAQKIIESWKEIENHKEWLLPLNIISGAKNYLDWIGPSIIRHDSSSAIRLQDDLWQTKNEIQFYPCRWNYSIVDASTIQLTETEEVENNKTEIFQAFQLKEPINIKNDELYEEIENQLNWQYSHNQATLYRPKQSVTELKRKMQEEEPYHQSFTGSTSKGFPLERPKFISEQKMNQAEKGTATHAVMQNLDYQFISSHEEIMNQISSMVLKELITHEQGEAVNSMEIFDFCQSELGQLVKNAHQKLREVPFSYGVSTNEIYKDWQDEEEVVLIQGIIDLLLIDGEEAILIDYKTDRTEAFTTDEALKKEAIKRYGIQLDLYSKAIEAGMDKKVKAKYLYFFDGGHIVEL
ncbi:helicase-exonuclease AddAB subunit AddA [Bacillus sp. AFS017336]|uniref:helicase-exonuclease AddAB subunit AddA n=1 Tax=Bacillus sp. AFS017336 TaxID=2033489 RepID=UPI000BF0EA20|nr:helicase-exonuclease AddAB subunit AddA [Bacillus sp. AFS017336]PEL09733.1 helicase-exonuclease AddAB subunit AddA [Bacillus sp. AFS017336]